MFKILLRRMSTIPISVLYVDGYMASKSLEEALCVCVWQTLVCECWVGIEKRLYAPCT